MSRRERVSQAHTRRAANRAARTNAGCLLGILLLPFAPLLAHSVDGSSRRVPDDYRRGYNDGRAAAKAGLPGVGGGGGGGGKGCGLLLLVPPALATLGGYAGWLTGGWS